MPTRPARAPLRAMDTSGLPKRIQLVTMAPMAPAAAARLVTKAMRAKLPPSIEVVEPALKPNHPSQRMNTPMAASGMLWPTMALALPSALNLPLRAPRTMAPARAAQPPTLWTTVEPAKSTNPSPSSQPPPCQRPPQAQEPVIG